MLKNNVQEDVISLDFYKPSQKFELENYYLPQEQLKFTSLPIDAIKKCELEVDRYPIVILHNNKPAGFFVLHGWEGVKEYYENQDAILLRAYSVHSDFQGRGIAKESLHLLPVFVRKHFPNKNEIILAVNYQNKAAQQVYLKCGYEDKGIRVMGKKGELFIFHMDL
ncbi:GNAT family N-acetyltransferase [Cytobacillus dafuensis]|uniref:GNAT family N-acetyltransferase n=1 Tax=Cytobacillus dafuensis TaxID=1742359 RepID=A0A5B8Z5V0_CYTDA|nr:GNAT family N-acetyltransferase [Cytobacillus dafuensis]QED48341.1 GNAT family N-acetyltransferase [Cytobacillus dafuensis]